MTDIEDCPVPVLGFDLCSGSPVFSPLSYSLSNSSCGIVELSRREDAKTALDVCWEALVLRLPHNARTNALIGKKYRMDLSDRSWRALVLWTKDPGGLKKHLEREHPLTGDTLFHAWPAIYVVLTLNGFRPDLEPGTPQDSLEEILADVEELCYLLAERQKARPKDVLYPKVGDPLVRYHRAGESEVRKNWDDFGPVYAKLAELGFDRVHYGPLDTRGVWKRAEDMAKEQGIELIPFDWEDPEDVSGAVEEISEKVEGLRLVTCSDKSRFGKSFGDGRKIREGICVPGRAINKLLAIAGEDKIAPKKSTKPNGGGKRSCDCQDTADIGQNVLRRARDERRRCRECVYCFVRCKSKGVEVKRKRV